MADNKDLDQPGSAVGASAATPKSTATPATCKACGALAVWFYSPSDGSGAYCDEHIERGCSCQFVGYPSADFESGEENHDEQGRLLPCIEYDFSATGFDLGGFPLPERPNDR